VEEESLHCGPDDKKKMADNHSNILLTNQLRKQK